jgi:hypothetical protein
VPEGVKSQMIGGNGGSQGAKMADLDSRFHPSPPGGTDAVDGRALVVRSTIRARADRRQLAGSYMWDSRYCKATEFTPRQQTQPLQSTLYLSVYSARMQALSLTT